MAGWRSVLREYARSTLGHAMVLLAGSVGVVLLAISLAVPRFTRIAGLVLIAAALVMGQYLAWLDMKRERDQLIVKRNRMDLTFRLGMELEIGRHLLSSIEWDCDKFKDALEEWSPEIPSEKEKLEELMREESERTRSWEQEVSQLLSGRLDFSYVARFESDAGLVPAVPPASLTIEVFVRRWRDHEMRLQRLHQFIEELSVTDSR